MVNQDLERPPHPIIPYERFVQPEQGAQYASEYDIASSEIGDLIGRQPEAFSIRTFDMSVAGKHTIKEAGFGFVPYGFNPTTLAKLAEAYIAVAINNDGSDPSQIFPGKTGRGFHGSFAKLVLTWPAQSGVSMQFIIFKSEKYPWIGGLEAL